MAETKPEQCCGSCEHYRADEESLWPMRIGECLCPVPVSLFAWKKGAALATGGASCPTYDPKEPTNA